ncbi:MAG: LysM peptidoglycan-binding domain-containing protein [Spirochaetes bacterium]|nr:LysM peptidoglycan-binding domain-containing protein [Spirochaetota bacterium]
MPKRAGAGCILLLFILVFFPPLDAWASLFEQQLDRTEVKKALERFLSCERSFVQRGLDNSKTYLPIVRDALEKEDLPAALAWLPLIESAYSVRAYSRTGACGIWQFMPQTGKWYDLRMDFWVDERKDPFKSSESAARHLKDLYRYYKNWELALAAYNAGMGSVNRAIQYGGTRNYWELCRKKLLKRETRQYVPRFYAVCEIAEHPERYGFSIGEKGGFPDFEILTTDRPVDLIELAARSAIDRETIVLLNPELRRFFTPIGRKYRLRIPTERFAKALSVYHELPQGQLAGVSPYRVKSGETLSEIADRYDASPHLIALLNNIYDPRRLFAGRIILVPFPEGVEVTVEEETFLPKWGFNTQQIAYRIRRGDTLWEIATRYGTDVETILAINGLSFESTIRPGDEIAIWVETAFCR